MVYGFGLQPSRYSQAQYAAAVSQFYVSWYNDFVVTSSGGVTAKVIWPDAGTLGFGANDETVSEGIGYGMLIAVQMADKTLFDGLNNFYHANLDGKGLMNWQCEIALGSYTGCTGNNATDADQDVCMALYMAVSQWGGTTYLTQANSIAASLISYDFEANGTTMVSGGDSNQGYVYPDYCAPGWYRCFESKTGNVAWTGAVNWVYNTLCPQLEGTWTHGFVPNRVSATALTSAQAISPEGPDNHGYDASRWGWRMGTDYLWNGSNQAPMSLFAAQIYTGVSTNGYLNYIQEYWNALDGNTATKAGTDGASSPCSHLQIGPALVGCMAGLPKNPVNQSFVDDTYDELYNRLLANSGCATMEYFQDTLGLMCLMTSTGNFPNMACNGCAAGTAPPTPTPIPCFRLDELENDSLNNSTNGYWFTFAYASVNNTPVNPTPTRSISSGVSYILQAPGDVSPYAAAVSGFWEDNGTVTVSGGVTSNIYGGFAIATQLDPPYTNLQNLSVGGAGPCSLLDISFFVKATQAMTMRLNFYNPAIDPANGGNANQFGYTFPVSTVWQGVTVTYNQIMCQDWNNAGFCYGLAKNGTVSLTRSQALTNVTSIQWDTAGNPATLGYEVDDVCMHFVQVSNGYFTPVVISTATPLPTATNTPGAATNTFTTTPSATRTNTATNTATFTMTSTRTNTATNSPTPTATNTVANTATFTPTPTRTNTATSTLTPTGTNTPANTATNTATSTATSTRTNTPANTATNTSTNTVANTPTNTSTNSSTSTATFTRTNTATNTATFTSTLADTATDTSTATVTPTRTATSTPTNTATVTDTLTATSTATSTSTATRTNTPTSSFTPTITDTATITSTPTSTTTGTQPPTSTPTNTATVTDSFTATHTATNTGTSTATLTPTSTPTSTHTPTNTTTQTATSTATNTLANTATPTSTATNTLVNTATVTNTLTNTASNTPTLTPTNTATSTTTSTATSTPTVTDTATITSTPTNTQTGTQPPTSTPTNTATKTNTLTATMTIMNTSTFTTTRTATPTATYTPTNSLTNTATPSATDTLVDTATPTSTWVTVNASAGNNPPGVSTQLPGVTNVPVQQILLTNPSGSPVTMIEIMVGISGNGNLSGITNLTLYSNGVSVTSTTAITSGGMATFFLSNNDILAGGGSVTYMIQADFNSAASGQYTFTMTGGTGSNGQPIMINFVGGLSGVPGATVFIEAATATPTTTASTTPTSSPTAIANTTPVVFPNPSTGDPVVLSVDTSQAVNSVDVSVYTTAFRRVQHQTAQPNGGTVIASTVSSGSKNWKIQLVMKDDKDNELASGLYYVVVSTPNSRQVIKLLLLR